MKKIFRTVLWGALLSAVVTAPAAAQLATADDVTESDYRIYRSDGTPATMAEVRAALASVEVVFVGELHNDPVSHHIEQQVLEGWFDTHGHAAALSLEMFSRDVQYIVDEYLSGLITDTHFQQASSPWSNYKTDYRPLVEFAKAHGLPVIAANAPRRYANMVSRNGRTALASLSDQALSYLAPLPYAAASERYEAQWNQVMADAMAAMQAAVEASSEGDHAAAEPMPENEGMRHGEMQHGEMRHGEGEMNHAAMREKHHPDMTDEEYEKMKAEKMAAKKEGEGHQMGEGMDHSRMDHGKMDHSKMNHSKMNHDTPDESSDHAAPAAQPQHGGGSMLDAQSLWDATMAWSIADHMTRRPGAKVAHFVGGFHVEAGTGTPEHLSQYRPGTRMLIISVQSVDDPTIFDPDEHTGLGDFVVLGDVSLPRTYETRTR
ncbi:MAG: ChaN family lipoprotein [Rhodothermales bacterium]